ncbi:MAG: hypothetical protein ACI31G_02750 [Bacilli bacterium]
MEFQIINTEVFGLDKSLKASGNPMRTKFDRYPVSEKDWNRSMKLGSARNGQGHDNFLKGIIVQMDLIAPLYYWKQAQRYHWFDFVSSQSTMHCLLKFDVESQCVSDTNKEVIAICKKLVNEYLQMDGNDPNKVNKWRELVASLPCGFCLGATMTTNYQQLKTMYLQRRYHKLKEWHVFCDWCLSLPHFVELTGVDKL